MFKWKEESVNQLGKLHSYFKNCYNHSSLQQPTSLIKLRQDHQYWGKTLNQQKGCNLLNDNGYHLLIMKFFKAYTVSTEKKMAPYSSTLAWKIPWTEKPGRLAVHGVTKKSTERVHFHFSLSRTGEGNGNPLQCSCLENPRDGGAWRAAVYGVAQLDMTEAT